MVNKRQFYENNEEVVTKPGLSEEISSGLKNQESHQGHFSFVKGMGIRTTPFLDKYFSRLRTNIFYKTEALEAELETQKAAFNNQLADLKSYYEEIVVDPIFPNLTYILAASFAGAILANKRSLATRLLTPLVFGGVAFHYLTPRTFQNMTSSLKSYESQKFPALRETRENTVETLSKGFTTVERETQKGNVKLQDLIHNTRAYIYDLLK